MDSQTAASQSTGQETLLTVKGLEMDNFDGDLNTLIDSLLTTGGQATQIGQARQLFKEILEKRKSPNPEERPIVYLGYTANMVSCGLRDIIRYMCQNKMVDVVVTTGGGVEEDIIKCQGPTYIDGEFVVDDKKWRAEGKNRIGNMFILNDNYMNWEDWLGEHYQTMLEDQQKNGTIYGPSDFIRVLGEKIDNPESIYYWCAKNDIQVFSPAITDGSIGDVLYGKGYEDDRFFLDLNKDLQKIMSYGYKKNRPLFAFLWGGGVIKYHILNACKMAGGIDAGIFLSVATEFDNSCSGSKPQTEVTRQTVKPNARIVTVNYEASIAVPLIMANLN